MPVPGAAWIALAWLVSAVVVRASIGYARRRGLLDAPGQRRSHSVPTPRGGGVGIVLACLVALPATLALGRVPMAWRLALDVTLLLVAAIGWWDDHRSLRPWPRLAVQLVACLLLAGAVAGPSPAWLLLTLVLAGAWSINLHNFMDGIDGLLAAQAVVVSLALAWLAQSVQQPGLAAAALATAAACLGFGWFNRPPARIFMGDVGSGSLGLVLFGLAVMLWRLRPDTLPPTLIAFAAFAVDAGLTLASRMLAGRRWYAPHREHLYQWLVRSGRTHGEVVAGYLGFNLLVVAPAVGLARHRPDLAWLVCLVVYVLAGATWIVGKRHCRRRKRHEGHDVST